MRGGALRKERAAALPLPPTAEPDTIYTSAVCTASEMLCACTLSGHGQQDTRQPFNCLSYQQPCGFRLRPQLSFWALGQRKLHGHHQRVGVWPLGSRKMLQLLALMLAVWASRIGVHGQLTPVAASSVTVDSACVFGLISRAK